MGFWKRFKASVDDSTEEDNNVKWKVLVQMEQLDQIVEQSKEMPVAIFKHSTRCGVSRGVLKSFEREFQLTGEQIELYFLDLLAHRKISDEIAAKFKVRHESPQLIVIKGGDAVYSQSHNSIDAADLEKFV